jgi:hypothetical protein
MQKLPGLQKNVNLLFALMVISLNMKERKTAIANGATASPAPAPGQRLITKAELAAALQFNPRTINNFMKQRKIPFIKVGSGRQADVRFDLDEVILALKTRCGVQAGN